MQKLLTLFILIFLFQQSSNAQFSHILDFDTTGGTGPEYPHGNLLRYGAYFYGVTLGGTDASGVIFKVKTDGSGLQEIFNFNDTDGYVPGGASPSLVSDGNYLYGMTASGGANNWGNIFKIKPDGTDFKVLLNFDLNTNGASPNGPLMISNGYLYGMASEGAGNYGQGIVFKIKTDGTGFQALKVFSSNVTNDGANPNGALVTDGTYLYGTTASGGTDNYGTIFRIKPDGTDFTYLLNFSESEGVNPYGSLVLDSTYLLGMTESGGAKNVGTIFRINTDGTGFKKLLDFNSNNGANPFGSLIVQNNYLYGLTFDGGLYAEGNVFKIKTDGTGYVDLHDMVDTMAIFTTPNGFQYIGHSGELNPYGSLYSDGANLYGTTYGTDAVGGSTIFKLNIASPLTSLMPLQTKPAVIYANRENTDSAGWTHYYFDNNTPDNLSDDTLLLSINKLGQDIGTIGDGTFNVKVVATAAAGSNTAIKVNSPLIGNDSGYWVMNRYWQVTPTHEPVGNVGVRFYYTNQDLKDINGSFPTHNVTSKELTFYKTIGGSADPTTGFAGSTQVIGIKLGTYDSDTTWTFHQINDSVQYSEFTVAGFSGGGGGVIGNSQTLPVTITSFTGSLVKTNALLNWQTTQQINVSKYTVERSLNGINFSDVGSVNAIGSLTATQNYSYTDADAATLGSLLYYRLKIIDKNGNFVYSSVVEIKISGLIQRTTVYPNPVHTTTVLQFTASSAKKYTIAIFSITGQVVKRLQINSIPGINRIVLNFATLPAAGYIINMTDENNNPTVLKIIKE